MDSNVEAACAALDEFARGTQANFSAMGNATLIQNIGWYAPALTPWELAQVPARLARRLREADSSFDEEIADEHHQANLVISIPGRLASMAPGVSNLGNGNITQGGWAFFETFAQWERILFPGDKWREPDEDTLPGRLRKQLKLTKKSLESIIVDRDTINEQLAAIKDGADLIGDLPVDSEMIANARKDVAAALLSATEAAGKSKQAAQDAIEAMARLTALKGDAEKVLSGIEDVYRSTTSHALAEAFNSRAAGLRTSVRWWVGLLIGALTAGAVLGYLRVQAISELTKEPNIQRGIALIWVQVALGIVSLAAPLWVAWLATRQISQRFRLAEDYSFKASLATAYEGYRREAARIDEQFEKDLFGSALRHLDQEPLRFMADADHSSPYAELLSSPVLKDAMAKIPGFAGELTAFISDAVTRSEKPSRVKPGKPPRSAGGPDDES
ncbi:MULTISPECIES: hypothetical protein [Luteibacter]|uniref:hypothetical protein n=1 Tax=Luteibacter TaxID=242605 RepID=UPI00068A5A2D|nr:MULTISPECIES: hypothetical protein [unclassified Luteibacter]